MKNLLTGVSEVPADLVRVSFVYFLLVCCRKEELKWCPARECSNFGWWLWTFVDMFVLHCHWACDF